MVASKAARSASARSFGRSGGAVNGQPISCRLSTSFRICRSRSLRAKSMISGTSASSLFLCSAICSSRLICLFVSQSGLVILMLDHDQPQRPSTSPRSIARLISLPPG